MHSGSTTLRSDARRNRERLIASARELFAREGVEVSVEEITHHAGLGMGTLYRHFPTKDELIDAVLEDTFADVLRYAEEGAAAADAWQGLISFFERVSEMHAKNRGFKDVIASRGHGARAEEMRKRVHPLVTQMIARAQEQGALRQDFTPEDIALVFLSTGRVIEATAGIARDTWRRHLAFLTDGLRAKAATEVTTPPLTRSQLARVRAGRK